jgi:pyridoxal 5'-phosphate synthase pdxT subunit
MIIGVLDVQGDVAEHMAATRKACVSLGLKARTEAVRTPEGIRRASALIIPGGESTTVGMLMERYGMVDPVREAAEDVPVFGTCAGMVMLAKEGGRLKRDGQPLLGLMDAKVIRNAYGSQKDSFEARLSIPAVGAEKFPGVFIRAPALERVWGRCKAMSRHGGRIVLARQDNLLAASFHPELTEDARLHEYFLGMI